MARSSNNDYPFGFPIGMWWVTIATAVIIAGLRYFDLLFLNDVYEWIGAIVIIWVSVMVSAVLMAAEGQDGKKKDED